MFSSWPDTALIFNFSLIISSSSSSILKWSLLIFISAYSERLSACFSLMFNCLICSWYFSSLFLAFSSLTSSCFWFSPIAASSSSMTTTRASAVFTLSSARFSSSSIIDRERAKLSYFISLSWPLLPAEELFWLEHSHPPLCPCILFLPPPFLRKMSAASQESPPLHTQVFELSCSYSNISIKLVADGIGLLTTVFILIDLFVKIVSLSLHRLHLFPDGIHDGVKAQKSCALVKGSTSGPHSPILC